MKKPCKRCEGKPTLTEDDINRMVEEVTSMKGIRLVEGEEYERRIGICKTCEKLEYGTTCMLCGCVMQVRARLKEGRCPYPKARKW